jgi:hypothetical protein
MRTTYGLAVTVTAVGLIASACSSGGTATQTTVTVTSAAPSSAASSTSAASSSSAAASTSSSAAGSGSTDLPSLIPTPADNQATRGPDNIQSSGIHLYFKVNGKPGDVMNAYKAALEGKGWQVTTVTSSGGGGGGGSTLTGTNGAAYGVFDGGGYNTNTFLNVCAWPTKPANPNCNRGEG